MSDGLAPGAMATAAMADDLDPAKSATKIPVSAWLGLAALALVNIYAVIDRQIFGLLAEPIRKDMGLSDTQLGLLQGVGLTLVGILTVYPIAWLGDRMDRRKISAAVILLWSVAVIGCGFSPNFAWLFLFASFVGIGENARAPVAFAMLPDLFPISGRQLGNSIYVFVNVISTSISAYLTGLLVSEIGVFRAFLPAALADLPDWRLSFIVAASFVPLAILLTLNMPARTAGPGAVAKAARKTESAEAPEVVDPSQISIWRFIWQNRKAQFGFNIAFMVQLFGVAASTNYLAIIAMRDYKQTALQVGSAGALLALINAAIGFSLAALLFNRLQPKYGAQVPLMALTLGSVLAIFGSLLLMQARSIEQLYGFYSFLGIVLSIGVMTYPTVLQNMTLPHLRARMFALISIAQLVASGLGTVAGGAASDVLKSMGVERSLLVGGCMVSVICSAIAAIMFWRTRGAYLRLTQQIAA